MVSNLKKKKGKEGNAVRYCTRNQALTRLQLKLPEFRRLCILKGIHPREPKKKTQGQNKTYYHVKDINFLAHEPLLQKFRDLRAYERKIRRAKGKADNNLAQRLKANKPKYRLDHLVRERYPTFVDALRDLDDALTMLWLFAVIPAEKMHGIPPERCQNARRLTVEFQAYVTRTHALRKTFVSVKGVYFQAEVLGQTVTWLTPHALGQTLPTDVDYRVMLTFVEFHEAMVGFINFKLFHTLGLDYPPVLDRRLEEASAGLEAIMKDLAATAAAPAGGAAAGLEGGAGAASKASATAKASEKRLGTLAQKLATLEQGPGGGGREDGSGDEEGGSDGEDGDGEGNEELEDMLDKALVEAGLKKEEDVAAEASGRLFKGLVFFLSREVPREALSFVIRSCGGEVAWEGEGSPLAESAEAVTHHVCDRPKQGHRYIGREYVQPQWVFDSVNFKILCPSEPYMPGIPPPPHLSPFVDNEAEGYTPEFAETVAKWQQAARAAANGEIVLRPAAAGGAGAAEDVDEEDAAAEEAAYARGIAAEFAGVPYSSAAAREEDGEGEEEEEEEDEDEEEEKAPKKATAADKKAAAKRKAEAEIDEAEAMTHLMLPRKKKELYKAMQMGIAKKNEKIGKLAEKRQKISDGAIKVVK